MEDKELIYIIGILGVIYLCANGYDGWGWLIFLLVFI
jgi:hypothetical protein